ncbi:flagellar biosynthesis protein FlhF [Marinobacter sp. SS21]|uniref:flagellar biosynthesis protein FlhF n=1 Tax=Marinobacter sp. SS21 TaxID=2979460 RepID=UPI00232BD74D|nr:flagellar biosynthesis protein FlhF [Marinobacter sp. SS21]MDC0662152.1 flagellar biosynthesis protein FlhF [Marinobacter sp. SS21]
MKVKRFFASTMAEALKSVRDQMGPDAVILSNRRVDGGVEIVTALDYDENVARQRLGESALEASNGSRLAELQAEQHRRLEDELSRSRERITEVRDRRSQRSALHSPASAMTATAAAASPREVSGSAQSELAQMRAEIDSLRELVSGERAPASNAAVTGNAAAQQRLAERLQEYGLSYELAAALSRNHLTRNNGGGRLEDGWKQALKALATGVRTARSEWLEQGGVYALVGPTGAGKTTTIGKLAAQYVLRHGADSLALVTTDRFRVAAHEQLCVFGRILNVPVRVVDDSHSLDSILDELGDRHLVLIDTAGLTRSDKGYEEQLSELAKSRHDIRSHLVVSATSQPRIMKSVWHYYKMANLAGCIITKLDEALTLGESLGFAMETGLAVAYYTDGQKIPDDLHHADAVQLVRLGVERLKLQQATLVAEGA